MVLLVHFLLKSWSSYYTSLYTHGEVGLVVLSESGTTVFLFTVHQHNIF